MPRINNETGLKECSTCKEEKFASEFYRHRISFDGYRSNCKICSDTVTKKCANNKYEKDPDFYKRVKRKWTYKLSDEELDYLLNNPCEICGDQLNQFLMHIDHNHDTGDVRGILCTHCNRGLGSVQDNIEYMEKAIDYLIRTSDPNFDLLKTLDDESS